MNQSATVLRVHMVGIHTFTVFQPLRQQHLSLGAPLLSPLRKAKAFDLLASLNQCTEMAKDNAMRPSSRAAKSFGAGPSSTNGICSGGLGVGLSRPMRA